MLSVKLSANEPTKRKKLELVIRFQLSGLVSGLSALADILVVCQFSIIATAADFYETVV